MRVFELKFEVQFGKSFALCVGYAFVITCNEAIKKLENSL